MMMEITLFNMLMPKLQEEFNKEEMLKDGNKKI